MLNLFRRKEKTREGVKRSRETWFGRLAGLFQRGSLDEALWEEAEELLVGADVGVETTHRLLGRVKERVREERVSNPQRALGLLKEEMVAILRIGNGWEPFPRKDGQVPLPVVVLVVGVNGTGKTTSIAKLAHHLQADGTQVLLGAADTFRAAAIEQLQVWGQRVGAEVIAHQQGADPGAVACDTVQAARARGVQMVIVDTAGRLHTKYNLMEEL
ncbi:MAG: signal recognition particle receptor subunit alpha, partial [Chloroflexi bacterium]|nr:signal recognition particle receptor subunit alpha [Chloroflexota bacterium]